MNKTNRWRWLDIGDRGEIEGLLSSQYADMRRNRERPSEASLYFAILEDAIRCYLDSRITLRVLCLNMEARRWIFGENMSIVSFELCCSVLNLNPAWLRSKLARISGTFLVAKHRRERGPLGPYRRRIPKSFTAVASEVAP